MGFREATPPPREVVTITDNQRRFDAVKVQLAEMQAKFKQQEAEFKQREAELTRACEQFRALEAPAEDGAATLNNGLVMINPASASTPFRQNDDSFSNSFLPNDQFSIIFEFNKTVSNLNRTLESNQSSKTFINQNHLLTEKMPLNIWRNYLNSELLNLKLIDVIDKNSPPLRDYPQLK